MLTETDKSTLLKKANQRLAMHSRALLAEMPKAICDFFEENTDKVNADVVIVRSKDDLPDAAHARNTKESVLFIFQDTFKVTSYFSSVCADISISKALIDRA